MRTHLRISNACYKEKCNGRSSLRFKGANRAGAEDQEEGMPNKPNSGTIMEATSWSM